MENTAEDIAGTAYQVIAALAAAAGLFEHPEVERALDYFADGCRGELLPWGGGLPIAENQSAA